MIPIHKKNDRKVLKNYRPVALLSVAGMVLEKIVALQIEKFFEENNLFGSFQFGFRKNKSAISELLTLFDTLWEAKDQKKEIMLVLYDLSAAFDTISHEILLEKLKLYGFDENSLSWVKTYLMNRDQYVTLSGQRSSTLKIDIGTPQGSRLSPLLFLCLMADMDLWTDSRLQNFADDTQSIVINEEVKRAIEKTKKGANGVISFFQCNNVVNNADKAALMYNSKGKSKDITIEDIGGEQIKSTKTEKLLGLHINSDFNWSNHIEELSIDLKKRISLLRRIRERIPKEKLIIVAEAIFNSKIRYGSCVYLVPVFDKEDLKWRTYANCVTPKETYALQTLQNTMIRVIHGFTKSQHINMEKLRNKMKMMSVNQMVVYHTILETFNVTWRSSSEPKTY